MRSLRAIPLLLAFVCADAARASTFSFSTPNGANDIGAGNPLSAAALFTLNGNNTVLTVTLENNQANPAEDGQILDALTFQLKNQNFTSGASIDVSMAITEAISVQGDGAYTTGTNCTGSVSSGCSSYTTNWTQAATVSGSSATFNLCDATIMSIGCTGNYSAQQGIVGAPDTNGVYDNSHNNGGPINIQNPYIFEKVVFTASLSSGGGTFYFPNGYTTTVSNLMFGFGQDGTDVSTEAGTTPEPSTFMLMAAALSAGLAALWYRRRA